MHTPRLCIDGRIASELEFRGLIAQEVIDQLVSAVGEVDATSEWMEKNRTVLLSHPKQIFNGQLKRFDTRRRIGRSPLYWIWEKNFVKKANISAFHRFRPIDLLNSPLSCNTVTTCLPAKKGLPFFISRKSNHHYVVPSQADAAILEKNYQVPLNQVTVMLPSVRRYVHFVNPLKKPLDGQILFLVGDAEGSRQLKKLVHVFSARYPHQKMKVIRLYKKNKLSALPWMKTLQNTKLCVYLMSQPFDWPTLALEAMYWNIPTLFTDNHHSLNELLPNSPFRLSNYLIDQKDIAELEKMELMVRLNLRDQGVFDPLALARQYKEIYQDLPQLN